MIPFIILLGAPGSGKGTQSQLLTDSLNIPSISTGDLLRNEIKLKSPIGLKLKSIVESGQLVPDKIIIDIYSKVVSEGNFDRGLISDGFPRTEAQAIALDALLNKFPGFLTVVIYFETDLEHLKDRLLGRRLCPDCGEIYHVGTNPPLEGGVCKVCGSKVIQRQDDTESVITNRFNIYQHEIKPVLAYYSNRLKILDGLRSKEAVFDDLKTTIKKTLNIMR